MSHFKLWRTKLWVWGIVMCWQGMKGLSHSSLLTPCPHPFERNRACKTQWEHWFYNTGTKQKPTSLSDPLRLGAWEMLFKLASITWQLITSFRVIFFLFFFFLQLCCQSVCLSWQHLSCLQIDETSRLHYQPDWSSVFPGESLNWQIVTCYKSIKFPWFQPEGHQRTAAEDLAHFLLEQKYCFHLPRAGLFKI